MDETTVTRMDRRGSSRRLERVEAIISDVEVLQITNDCGEKRMEV